MKFLINAFFRDNMFVFRSIDDSKEKTFDGSDITGVTNYLKSISAGYNNYTVDQLVTRIKEKSTDGSRFLISVNQDKLSWDKEIKKVQEQNTTGDVATQPSMLPGYDMLYRSCPCFKINEKEFRELVKSGTIPEKVKKYAKEFAGEVYMRYGTNLNFNTKHFSDEACKK